MPFAKRAEEAIQLLYQARADFRNEQAARRASLSFSALHSIALTFFPSWIGDLKSKLGLGSTRMSAGRNVHECVETFVNGNCDFLICYSHEAVPVLLDPLKFPSHVLTHDQLIPVCGADGQGEALYGLHREAKEPIPYLSHSNESSIGRILEHVIETQKLERHLEIDSRGPYGRVPETNGIGR